MIYVKRNTPPPIGEQLADEKNKLSEYLNHIRQIASDRSRILRVTRSYRVRDIKELELTWYNMLLREFKNKCAYCERAIDNICEIDHFRPVDGIKEYNFEGNNLEFDGDFHYIWLAYQWDNMLPACNECIKNKGNYFPVVGRRARLFANMNREKHLLINPSRDRPEEHLYCNSEGILIPKSHKGEVTIQILDLNSKSLTLWRKEQINTILQSLTRYDGMVSFEFMPELSESLIKQLAAEKYLHSDSNKRLEMQKSEIGDLFLRKLFGNFKTDKDLTDILRTYTNNKYELGESGAPYKHFRSYRIESIKLTNIRNITFEHFFKRNGKQESWFMLIGENGTGKTTVLKAIAMALTQEWRGLEFKPLSFAGEGDYSEIQIKLENESMPIQVKLSDGNVVHNNIPEPMPVIAYGAIRLIPKRARKQKNSMTPWHNIQNLFASNAHQYFINHPGEWLEDQDTIRKVARIILDVLPIHGDDRVDMVIDQGQAYIDWNHNRIPLHELSSGYQSIIALVTDITRSIYKSSGLGKFAEGIVLIDELDAHLHPNWKLRIVSKLREAFPNMQFIVTSHDPLCLRGTRYGEVAVMKRMGHQIQVTEELPNQEGMRIDQILTSELFGMDSTMETATDDLIKEYQKLVMKGELKGFEIERMHYIEEKLDEPSIKYLGYTNREMLLYKTIDKFIAERKSSLKSYTKLDDETERKILGLWESDEEIQ